MPIYKYECPACGEKFEPDCNLERMFGELVKAPRLVWLSASV